MFFSIGKNFRVFYSLLHHIAASLSLPLKGRSLYHPFVYIGLASQISPPASLVRVF